MKMKFIYQGISLATIFTGVAFSLVAPHLAAQQRFDIKCHVDLVGGGDAIYFVTMPRNDIELVRLSLPGQSVPLAGFKNNRTVYKVVECTQLNSKFKKNRSQLVDKATLR